MIFNEKNMLGMYLSILVLCKYVGKYLVGYKYTSKSCILGIQIRNQKLDLRLVKSI